MKGVLLGVILSTSALTLDAGVSDADLDFAENNSYKGCTNYTAIIAVLFLEQSNQQKAADDLFDFFQDNERCDRYSLPDDYMSGLHEHTNRDVDFVQIPSESGDLFLFWPPR